MIFVAFLFHNFHLIFVVNSLFRSTTYFSLSLTVIQILRFQIIVYRSTQAHYSQTFQQNFTEFCALT